MSLIDARSIITRPHAASGLLTSPARRRLILCA